MKFPVIIEPAAEADLQAAFEWYEDQVEGLGHEFFVSIRACLGRLERTPKMYPSILENLRRARVERFPFGIFYSISGEAVYVIGVLHHRKNPESLAKRFKTWGDS